MQQEQLRVEQQIWLSGVWQGPGVTHQGPWHGRKWKVQCSPPMFLKEKMTFLPILSHPRSYYIFTLQKVNIPSHSFSWQLEKVKIVQFSLIFFKIATPCILQLFSLKNKTKQTIVTTDWCSFEKDCRTRETGGRVQGPSFLIPTLPWRRCIYERFWGRSDLCALPYRMRGLPVLKTSSLNFRMTDSVLWSAGLHPPTPPLFICWPNVQGHGIKIWGLWGD